MLRPRSERLLVAAYSSANEKLDDQAQAIRLRIVLGRLSLQHRSARSGSLPLYEAIVMKARAMKLAGATVIRGQAGYGSSGRLHRAKSTDIAQDVPVVIDIVDTETKIQRFLPVLAGMMTSGLVTTKPVDRLAFKKHRAP